MSKNRNCPIIALFHNNHFSVPFFLCLHIIRISKSSHAIHHMIRRDAKAIQDFPDRRLIADALKLVDPNRADSKGMSGQEDIFHGAGIS